MADLRQQRIKMCISKQLSLYLLVLMIACLQAPLAMALGTPPGTDITNQAMVTYIVEGDNYTRNSNVTTNRVDEVIDVSVVWQDTSDIIVDPGDTNQILTFRVTNTGNGTETFHLTVDSAIGGGEYNPSFVNIYLDTSGNGLYDAGVDELYFPTVNDPTLPADGSAIVFVLNNIPVGISNGDHGNSQLSATSATGTGVPGTVFPSAGDGGTDAVLGAAGGSVNAMGTYFVSSVTVSLVKSVQVTDPTGGSEPVTGAVLTYSIAVAISGSGTAESLVITDPTPPNTTYRPGSLTLNTVSLTDAADADAGDVGVSTPNGITVLVGDLSAVSPLQIITFDVIIN